MDTHMDHRANRGEQEAGQQRTHTHALCSGGWKAVVAHGDKERWAIAARLPVFVFEG